jgi:hypothetical protein
MKKETTNAQSKRQTRTKGQPSPPKGARRATTKDSSAADSKRKGAKPRRVTTGTPAKRYRTTASVPFAQERAISDWTPEPFFNCEECADRSDVLKPNNYVLFSIVLALAFMVATVGFLVGWSLR